MTNSQSKNFLVPCHQVQIIPSLPQTLNFHHTDRTLSPQLGLGGSFHYSNSMNEYLEQGMGRTTSLGYGVYSFDPTTVCSQIQTRVMNEYLEQGPGRTTSLGCVVYSFDPVVVCSQIDTIMVCFCFIFWCTNCTLVSSWFFSVIGSSYKYFLTLNSQARDCILSYLGVFCYLCPLVLMLTCFPYLELLTFVPHLNATLPKHQRVLVNIKISRTRHYQQKQKNAY